MFNFGPKEIPDLKQLLMIDYHKIAKINLADNSYQIILLQDGEEIPQTDNFCDWLDASIEKYVHPEDREMFRANTAPECFKRALEGESINFIFRRKAGDEYEDFRFIFVPAGSESTTGYVFIKYVI